MAAEVTVSVWALASPIGALLITMVLTGTLLRMVPGSSAMALDRVDPAKSRSALEALWLGGD